MPEWGTAMRGGWRRRCESKIRKKQEYQNRIDQEEGKFARDHESGKRWFREKERAILQRLYREELAEEIALGRELLVLTGGGMMGTKSKNSEGRYTGTEARQKFLAKLALVVIGGLFIVGILAVR